MATPSAVLTVGPVPSRRGVWLGIDDLHGTWRALAKFRSPEAAEEFLTLFHRASSVALKWDLS